MPLTDKEIQEKQELPDGEHNLPRAIYFLQQNKDNWFYIGEIAEKTGMAQSSVSNAVQNHEDKLKQKKVKEQGRIRKYVKYKD